MQENVGVLASGENPTIVPENGPDNRYQIDQTEGSSAAEYVRNRRVVQGPSFEAELSRMDATVERQVPHPAPAPVFSMISFAEENPAAAASRMSFSVTAMQMQTYICRPTWFVRIALVENSFQIRFVNCGGI